MLWIVLILLVVIAAFVAIIVPVFGRPEPWVLEGAGPTVKMLRKEKGRVLRLLKDLELEREAGSIDEERYEELRQSYLTEAAVLNRRLEELDSEAPVASTEVRETADTKGGTA